MNKKYFERQKNAAKIRLEEKIKEYASHISTLPAEHAREILSLTFGDLQGLILEFEKTSAAYEAVCLMEDEENA